MAVGAGFLLAVLWFDLMFDTLALEHRRGEVPERSIAAIAAYYRRVTTDAAPMNLLVAAAMSWTFVAVIAQFFTDTPTWVPAVSLVLVGAPMVLAGVRTVPFARRLGMVTDPLGQRRAAALRIGRDHGWCLASIAALIVLQLTSAAI